MDSLDNCDDTSINLQNDIAIGFDWKGDNLYGYESGFMIDGEFVCEDDILTYIESKYDTVLSIDVL